LRSTNQSRHENKREDIAERRSSIGKETPASPVRANVSKVDGHVARKKLWKKKDPKRREGSQVTSGEGFEGYKKTHIKKRLWMIRAGGGESWSEIKVTTSREGEIGEGM